MRNSNLIVALKHTPDGQRKYHQTQQDLGLDSFPEEVLFIGRSFRRTGVLFKMQGKVAISIEAYYQNRNDQLTITKE